MSSTTARRQPLPSDDPRAQASRRQQQAAYPQATAWVDASAGSGKTTVLINRVLRLLLAGVEPYRILCLTFTKAAAANMANRLTSTLAQWATLPEKELYTKLFELTEQDPDEDTLLTARRLFAQSLETPGGMQFQTIHGFCQSLLARFPLEAGVPVGFGVLDERASSQMLGTIRLELLREAELGTDSMLTAAVDWLLEHFGPDEFPKLEAEIIGARSQLEGPLQNGYGLAVARLRNLLELKEGESLTNHRAGFIAQLHAQRDELSTVAQALANGSKNDLEQLKRLNRWLSDGELDGYLELFFTQEMTRRKSFVTNSVSKTFPAIPEQLQRLADDAQAYLDRQRELTTYQASASLIIYAAALLSRYHAAKHAKLALDYDDLITKATQLVSGTDAASWVLYKLDGGIEHVLVDEAQDTNPLQWTLLQSLSSEFYSGEGRYDSQHIRTFFAVGDFKQSIFSFQGARPQAFLHARTEIRRAVEAAGQTFRAVDFIVSFRTVAAVLDIVDATFGAAPANQGLPDYQNHISAQSHLPGRVDVWPPAPSESNTPESGWRLPTTRHDETHPRSKLASVIAAQIKAWVTQGERLPARGRAIRYGDVMVLVRTRGRFVPELIRACKKINVPVAGADRMVLLDQLAVEDVLTFADFLLLPQDDLTLATLLKSPFIGISEEQLYALAHGRTGTLWQALGHNHATRPIAQWLDGWLDQADRITPYTLIAHLLAKPCPASARSGRHALLSRLGPDANDPLDELLASALSYEQSETPSLQGFLHWLRLTEASIKRELEQAGDQVRIMTAHGAKGLEAPIVIVVDPLSGPTSKGRLLADPDGVEPPFVAPSREQEAPIARARRAATRALELEEYHRLLYVALTRAEDWLIVASWQNKNNKKDMSERDPTVPSWYDLVYHGISHAGGQKHNYDFSRVHPELGWQGEGYCYQVDGRPGAVRSEKHHVAHQSSEVSELPEWAVQPPAPEPSPSRPLRPSAVEDDTAALSPLAAGDSWRWQRGLTIHRLLQTLPDMPADQRPTAARRWLTHLPPEVAEKTWHEVEAVLSSPDFAPLFGPSSRAEVPVTGLLNNGVVIAGQIDRLAVTDEAVWIVDFKTNRPPALTVTAVPKAYLKQLASYRAVLAPIYPGKSIKAALLWTHEARLMAIPAELLDEFAPAP